jgi:hypothetical protein
LSKWTSYNKNTIWTSILFKRLRLASGHPFASSIILRMWFYPQTGFYLSVRMIKTRMHKRMNSFVKTWSVRGDVIRPCKCGPVRASCRWGHTSCGQWSTWMWSMGRGEEGKIYKVEPLFLFPHFQPLLVE